MTPATSSVEVVAGGGELGGGGLLVRVNFDRMLVKVEIHTESVFQNTWVMAHSLVIHFPHDLRHESGGNCHLLLA